ncbi:hypothetical protein CBM2623_A150040 [Cupriavidus taiwanensis]|nr:hypothetical protein CBM2623_A150040 [Cupriavidus taiwanensis]
MEACRSGEGHAGSVYFPVLLKKEFAYDHGSTYARRGGGMLRH